MAAILAEQLTLRPALQALSLDLPAGSCTAVLGPNGAGKSTLLGLLAGALQPHSGSSRCAGPVSYLPEGLGIDGHLRVRAALAIVRGLPGWEPAVAEPLLQAFALPRWRRFSQLSQGQRTRLGLVLSLGRRAATYLLDDPFLGLDPMAQVVAERAIAERAGAATMVIASQHAAASERLCDHLLFLREGRLVWCAPTESWRERYRRVRVRGRVDAVSQLALDVLHSEPRGEALDLLLDDPTGTAERRLRIAGARVEPLPLPLDELLMMVAA